VADGTEVHTRDEFELTPAFELRWPIIGPLLTRRREKSMRDFKTMLETER
jgi:hypothetical protein